jgi:sulfur relay protein TusB/DsrH
LKIAEKSSSGKEKAAILHIQDACIAVTMDNYCERLAEARIEAYALKADCEARGLLQKVGRGVMILDYKEWVKLVVMEHGSVVSWTS